MAVGVSCADGVSLRESGVDGEGSWPSTVSPYVV